MVKNLAAMQETRVQPLGWEDSAGEGNGNPLQYSCLKSSVDRKNGGYSPWGRKKSDATKHFHFSFLEQTWTLSLAKVQENPSWSPHLGQCLETRCELKQS